MSYVIDPSVALGWALPDEHNPEADAIRAKIEGGVEAWIPFHWWAEFANGLLMAERRRRITPEKAASALSLVASLPLFPDEQAGAWVSEQAFSLARKHNLTLYDSLYLELARRRGAILATFDNALLKAAQKERVAVVLRSH